MKARVSVWQAAALLAGTTIGSGILGVPYAIAQSGLFTGLLYLFGMGGAILLLNMLFATIVKQTQEVKQIPGYVEHYLGTSLRWLMILTLLILGYGALTAYTAGSGSALAEILDTSNLVTRTGFLLVAFFFVAVGVKTVSKLELVLVTLLSLFILGIGFLALKEETFSLQTLSNTSSGYNFLAPYGVILFAYLGFSSIPELRLTLQSSSRNIYTSVLAGTLLPIILYTIFVLSVLGITGTETTRIATIGLGEHFGPTIAVISNIFAILAMFTSFLALALVVKNMFELDLNRSSSVSLFATFAPPITILVLGGDDFISILGLTGAIAGGTMGILIVLMFIQLQRRTRTTWPLTIWLFSIGGILLIAMLLIGMGVQIFTTL